MEKHIQKTMGMTFSLALLFSLLVPNGAAAFSISLPSFSSGLLSTNTILANADTGYDTAKLRHEARQAEQEAKKETKSEAHESTEVPLPPGTVPGLPDFEHTDSSTNSLVEVQASIPHVETEHTPPVEQEKIPSNNPPLSSSTDEKTSTIGVFDKGAVTFRLDDGWKSQYDVAAPALEAANMHGTFYIVTEQIRDNGFVGFMSKEEIQDIASRGHEIGAHTEGHSDLTTLSESDAREQIEESRNALLSWNVGPILSFAYPFGAYNENVMDMVRDAGFTSAVTARPEHVTAESDPFQLERRGVDEEVSLDQVKAWIDEAEANDEWLILTFHRIDTSGDEFSTPPDMFKDIVSYVDEKDLPVVTVTEGIQSLK